MRVRVGKIAALADDLALALSARTIRIQAPVPGKGYVGIEVPNEEIALVSLRSVIQSEAFKRLTSPLRFALGLNVSGHALAADLAAMPHLLVAGATGSGKSVCVNALITGLLVLATCA
jgi:S-DNA-T family DNA segregation ATPase FtsK/SpoIIIE